MSAPIVEPVPARPSAEFSLLDKPDFEQVETVDRIPLSSTRVDERARSQLHSSSPMREIASSPDEARRQTTPSARAAVQSLEGQRATPPSMREKQAATERDLMDEEEQGTVVEGIEDDNLWVLLRMFNTQVNHVLHPARGLPPDQPDLRQTNLPNVPYRSDTLKANLERFIKAIAPPSSRGIREVQRLSDWHGEFYRTLTYCAGYFISWGLGCTVVAALCFFAILVAFPGTRRFLFPDLPEDVPPPDPPRQGDPGGQGPQAHARRAGGGALGRGHGRHAGDLVAETDEPDNIVTDAYGKIVGYQTEEHDANAERMRVNGEIVKVRRDKEARSEAQSEADARREELTTRMAKATENGVGGAADFIEIMQKALSPVPVYPDSFARFKLAALLVAPALLLHYVPAQLIGRFVTLLFGVVFWGHEPMMKGAEQLMERFPNWMDYLDPRNHLLSGVPTNAQLTLHLLRASEAEGNPLPLPPVAPTLEEANEAINDEEDGVKTKAAKAAASDTKAGKALSSGNPDNNKGVRKAAKKTGGKTKSLFKRAARKLAGMGSDVTVVGEESGVLKKKINSMVLKAKWGDEVPEGGFVAKHNGTSGHLFLDDEEGCLSWVPLLSKTPEKVWYIDDLVEMKKQGLGVQRLALAMMSGAEIESLGLALRFAKTADDVSMKDMTEEEQLAHAQKAEESLIFRGVEAREQLFNRLIAMGHQRWEML
ncbi:hypothetical protein A1Q1_01094 [Trichosporon asahii var. asahii CBS 2479]|uniref:Uncharacterized protein n=1 Tax=Trichosporon asahii var. asahii (strain ATCC 90039 / CBS 2479 / JCM 2466 / KCTC 7840 / NBRC 103889/ NCYC 2677 / UAMH 7654) TaxID=1186058 RepID=J5QY96_TRIAS|nr:hypothetical protein A1Q1_01094 [Trichosporon asahii var. asahii CBS 2479]EJT49738.1 hypothetical protein A1Q1_01094 [Trichosporon asahii var. asahii CBS 2479]